jgi:hypothetical protein
LLFRDLLIDVAAISSDSKARYTILVVIDAINVLEEDDKISFYYVVDFFRALCDEMGGGPLSKYVTFKYMLLHPGYSYLLEKPHPRERLAVCTLA